MLSASDLASMRATVTASLPDTAQILRATWASDGMGGQTSTWSTVATVACRLSANGPDSERLVAGRVVAWPSWTLTVPAGTDLRATDRVVVGGRTLEVVGVTTGASDQLAVRALVVEAQ